MLFTVIRLGLCAVIDAFSLLRFVGICIIKDIKPVGSQRSLYSP